MPRPATWGTPGRSKHYLFPRGKWELMRPAAWGGVALLLVILGLHAAGWRGPVAPGAVTNSHAPVESRCEECHARGQGAVNRRCQRCHDPSGAGRLANAAHVLFGSRDAERSAQAPELGCALCHVEHRGRAVRLGSVDQTHCAGCHFRSFAGHPEFAVFRTDAREAPGLLFPHERHIQELIKQGAAAPLATCARCHQRQTADADFAPIAFDAHCADCHAKGGQLAAGVEPIGPEDVLSLEAMRALGADDGVQRAEEFETSRGRISKPVVRHRDSWVLFNLGKLRRELDPEGWRAERGALQARLDQLERRLALATPVAGLERPALLARATTLEREVQGLQARIEGQASARDPVAGLARLAEAEAAARLAGDPALAEEARLLTEQAQRFSGQTIAAAPLPRAEFQQRRRELLAVLDAVQTADPRLQQRSEDLRRRLLALTPGDTGLEILQRVRERRALELERVRDEIQLRDQGVGPPGTALIANERDAIQRSIVEVEARLAALSLAPGPSGPLSGEDLERKQQAAEVLAAPCAKCHPRQGARIAQSSAARPVLFRAGFIHRPHLLPVQGDCVRCHPTIEKSRESKDLNFKGVESCRECHGPRKVRENCQTCHRYHPPPVP